MDNTENMTNEECTCLIDYEAAYQNAMRELDEMWRENKSLRLIVGELAKIISR